MSRYVLTQEQLDRLQEQIQQLTRMNDTKQERIRELERHKVRVTNPGSAELIKTIGKLEEEVLELKRENERLRMDNSNEAKIRELERLLEEERKLRKYSEAFAKQLELRYAEESLIRELTTELCQLQKDEIEIDNKRIEELQKKLDNLASSSGPAKPQPVSMENERNHCMINWSRDNFVKNKQLRFITEQLRDQLIDLYKEIEGAPVKTAEDRKRVQELQKWLREAKVLNEDLNDIENLKNDLKYMRSEIENRRRSIFKYT